MTRIRNILAAMFAAGAVVSCGSSSEPYASVAGTIALQTINGQSLPYSFGSFGGQPARWMVADTIEIHSDGSYLQYTSTKGGGGGMPGLGGAPDSTAVNQRQVNGTFTYRSDTLSIGGSGGGSGTLFGPYDGTTFTGKFSLGSSLVYVYRKTQ